jgi:receptor expression-enhancing protein 5/6
LRALETEGIDDDKQWLTYWTIFGFFSIIDDFFGFLLGSILPMYFFVKVLFLIYLFSPTTRGATVIYKSVIGPLYLKYGQQIREKAEQVKQ